MAKKDIQEIKIMNYNILHGFHQIVPPFGLEQERLDKALKEVSKENPDILILTEACYGGPNPFNINMDYKKLFNYPYGYFGAWGEHEWGNLLLSKYPIEAQTIPYGKRTAIKSKINVNKKVVYLDVIHPHPEWTEDEKIELTKPLLKRIQKPYFLIGDFNAISDEDNYDKDLLIKGFEKFDKTPIQSVNRLFERKLIPYLKSKGLIDAFTKDSRQSTVPTSIYGEDKPSSMRMDFIFSSPDIKTLETRIIKNKVTDYASDHYPIVGRFHI
jgi:endonuclease/exonuclease/phosphatase family metal-dependent hydrolase